MTCTGTVYWSELDSGTLTQICFAKALEASQRVIAVSAFGVFFKTLVGCRDRIPERLKSVLGVCCPLSQSTNSQMGKIISDSSHQETSSPEHGWILLLCCPQRVVVALAHQE